MENQTLGKTKLSALLDKLLDAHPDQARISLRDMINVFGVRAYGPLLLMFALPNAIPSIPGLMAILGIPLLFLSVQMILGYVPWLPDILARQSLKRSSLISLRNRVYPWLVKADKIVRPRWLWMSSQKVERLLGVFIFLLSLSVFTPIPFTNMLPALSICVIAVGLLERDGLWLLAGLMLGTTAGIITLSILRAIFLAFFG